MTPSPPQVTARRQAPARSGWVGVAGLLLVVIGFLVHGNVPGDRFIGFDSKVRIRGNPDLAAITPLQRSLSLHLTHEDAAENGGTFVRRPVLSFAFALNSLFGVDARHYRAGNVVLHVTVGLLLFAVLLRLLRRSGTCDGSSAQVLALAVALLWLVHPIHTASVANIAQRAETLAALFLLATLWAALRSWEAKAPARAAWSVAAVVFALLGVATKETNVVAPVLVLACDALFYAKGVARALRRRPYFYLALALAWVELGALVAMTWTDAKADLRPDWVLTYAFSQPVVVLHYLKTVVWPDSAMLYHFNSGFRVRPGVDSVVPSLLCAVPLVAGLVATTLAAWRMRPLAFFGIWFFLLLAPSSSVMPTNQLIQMHRMYLPLVAPLVLVVLGFQAGLRRIPGLGTRRSLTVLALAVALACVALAQKTRSLNQDFGVELGPFVASDRPNAVAWMAMYAIQRADYAEAAGLIDAYVAGPVRERGAGDPASGPSWNRAEALNVLAVIDARQGRLDAAKRVLREALAIEPDSVPARNNAAVLQILDGRIEAGLAGLAAALAAEPDTRVLRANQAMALLLAGQADVAESAAAAMLATDPDSRVAAAIRDCARDHPAGLGNRSMAAEITRDDRARFFLRLVPEACPTPP